MANLTAQLTLDLSAAQATFTAVKNASSGLPAKIQAVQATIPSITVTGTPAGSSVAFVVDNAQTDAATVDLLTQVTTLRDAVIQLQADLDSMAPVVTNVA